MTTIEEFNNLSKKYQNRIKKALQATEWYHATTRSQLTSLQNGIDINHNLNNALDFGAGFYLTSDLEKAKEYIGNNRKYENVDSIFLNNDLKSDPIVLQYHIDNLWDIFFDSPNYKVCVFPTYNDEFANFVFENRSDVSIVHHDYDFIYGGQTDSNPSKLMADYQNNAISRDAVIEGLKKHNPQTQLYIHNQDFCDNLEIDGIIDITNN
ncbi:DUF3990 domain-containing protein [Leuconostoc gelidum subsp. gasicomitatum]|uniref:DUF3990 domain-containing protein n=1 Tax=Leuconostoc gasicomitatum TaxID=115778 RepID=UPI0015CB336D|nr:DUF3990 domain-containing protein [Leuconostoc gasicomitatum]MBZ5957730.1 DUF3990 domain-containing protein [Leuconostoc gasicomitatum]MBZ5969749.1 DUF3990 domain-containing protein [Leuconostoc gasicomitatum]QLG77360.1 DUF3990 domain-containing protein [Leuconostoc gasicomitatum]